MFTVFYIFELGISLKNVFVPKCEFLREIVIISEPLKFTLGNFGHLQIIKNLKTTFPTPK